FIDQHSVIYDAMATAEYSPDIPRRRNGEVDWKTLGTLLTADILGQVVEVSYVDPHYGHRDGQLKPRTDWEYVCEEHDVVVLKKRTRDPGIYSYMGRTVLNWPFEELAVYLDHIESTYQWDRLLTDIRYVEILNGSEFRHDAIVYRRYELERCFRKSKMDFVYFVHSAHHEGKFVRTVRSVDHINYPAVEGVTRGKFLTGTGMVLEPYRNDQSRTLVSYSFSVMVERMPSILVNMALKNIPLSIRFIEPQSRSSNGCGLGVGGQLEEEEEDRVQQMNLTPQLRECSDDHYEDAEPLIVFTRVEGVHQEKGPDMCSSKMSMKTQNSRTLTESGDMTGWQ
ncbi:hypothetical protein EMCRGX_G032797, partial [Ephydatia muelleri]